MIGQLLKNMNTFSKYHIKDNLILYFLEYYLEKIKSIFEPSKLWLWGSRVYGIPTEHSDIDLLIVSEKFAEVRKLQRRHFFLKSIDKFSDKRLCRIDAFCYTSQEFETYVKNALMFQDLFEKGIQII